jgi:RNA polymerase sigma-70 factor (ECF subfamily)
MNEEHDHAAFLALYVKHQGEIRAFVRALVRNRHDAEDICQNIALVLWKKFDQYDSTRPFAAWARGVAAIEVQLIRGQSHRVPTPFSPDAVQAILDAYNRTTTASESHQRQWLEKCIRLLSERGRSLFAMRYGLGTPVDEIASQIKATVGSVHRALSRYRAQVRECVNRQADQELHQARRPAE